MSTILQPAAAPDQVAPADLGSSREWLSARDVAQLLGISPRRVHQAVHRGELRAAVLDTRGRIVVHRAWARTWLEQLADRGAPAKHAGERSSVVRDFKVAAIGDCNDDGNHGAA
jgi:hypothetical protein